MTALKLTPVPRRARPLPPLPLLTLPPLQAVPPAVRAASIRYAATPPSLSTQAELIAAVDQEGPRWEHEIASRGLEARAELVEACRLVGELHDELVSLHAAARWLRSFPLCSSWDPEPYSLYVGGEEVAVPEVLGAIEDACDVDKRLRRIARRPPPREPAYAPRVPRPGSSPALIALAEAGWTLSDVARLMSASASESAVSLWLAGKRPYPDELPDVLKQLVDAETAARIISRIPPA
jgi:hypothetical protein